MTDTTRDLIQRMANELDLYRQMARDDCTSTHPFAEEARAYLAQAEPDGPAVLDSREPASVTAYPTSSMSELSPAAQAVFWAFNRAASGKPYDWHYLPAIAAALRAAADQVVPKEWPTIEDYNEYDQGVAAAHIKCRNQLLAIADELEAQ